VKQYQGAKNEFGVIAVLACRCRLLRLGHFPGVICYLGQEREETNEIRAKSSQVGASPEVSFASNRVTNRAVFRESSVHSGCAFPEPPFEENWRGLLASKN